jgi:hypothetical protein
MSTSSEIRSNIVSVFRRDLIGPLPVSVEVADSDLERERLNDRPSRWYLAGFIAPTDDPLALDAAEDDVIDPSAQEELDPEADAPDPAGAGGAAGDNETPDAPNTPRRFLPSSIGLTVLVDPDVTEIEANVTWGDYQTEPPLPESVLMGESEPEEIGADGKQKRKARIAVEWVRVPKARTVIIKLTKEGRANPIVVPESAAEQRRGGGLVLESHSRIFEYVTPDGTPERVRALTVFLVNRRAIVSQSSYAIRISAAARFVGNEDQGWRSATRRPALSRHPRMGCRPQFSRWLDRSREYGGSCPPRLDRSPSACRGRARSAE